ncbi:unnamed protein product [Didymodactylos carnosus]|uniref:NAD(+) kinase n=1 Tax=Didymodactylos carnosus TaxID=1234261 RepID=A0A814ALP6_9BILA|nr:unnamed protein product [Didymodactylos carnosus]CAF0915369.1 unnamed protein product [Didymodactylos carnosus]CAF3534768.1 unnamed protein product [Didymodactylos carnosus]CAF3695655.1 unnamed protein product [Didymodactylos carnosus]
MTSNRSHISDVLNRSRSRTSSEGNRQAMQDEDYLTMLKKTPMQHINSELLNYPLQRAFSQPVTKTACVIQDPSSQRLHWTSPPLHIMVIRKPGISTLPEFREIINELLRRRLYVYIEDNEHTHLPFTTDEILKKYGENCIAFDEENDLDKIDLIVCLGGDGTLLHVSSLFQDSCPPILSFSMGSLGFLTPFDYKNHQKVLDEVLAGNVAVLLRTRLKCSIIKYRDPESLEDTESSTPKTKSTESTEPSTRNSLSPDLFPDDKISHLALNEVVIDRGPNSYLSNLDLYINDSYITKVQGDGLIISTPTGSTAYAMAAGASMIHPNVPCLLICPICPHSLSFRPIVIPAGIELQVKVSEDTRLTAWLSVDGRNRHELHHKDTVRITTSVYPVPAICRFDQLGDWFESLAGILHWNVRKSQAAFNDTDIHDKEDDSSDTPALSPTNSKLNNDSDNDNTNENNMENKML